MREVSDALASYGVDVQRAREQHAAYCDALGVEVIKVPAEPGLGDCCFIEDTAVVEKNRALITRMGFPQRRPESDAVRIALTKLGYEIVEMQAPATLDGGDVLRVGDRTFVGLSSRTNEEGVLGLEEFLSRSCTRIPVTKCLHLKSATTEHTDGVLLIDPNLLDPFGGFMFIETKKPNCLRLPDRCLVSDAALEGTFVDISEFEKADGGLTCSTLLLSP